MILPFIFKGKIIEMAKNEANKTLNAKIDFSDDIGISLIKNFPKLSINIKSLSITGVDTFSKDTLIYFPELSVSLNLMSVIKGEEMTINKIYLKQPKINILVLENGKANYDIAKPDSAVTDTTPSKFKMALELLEIEDGDINYEDKTLPFNTSLKHVNHTMKGDFTLDEFILQTKTSAESFTMGYGGMNYLSNVKTEILADMDMNMKDMKFTFKENKINLNNLNLGANGFIDMNDEDMDFDLTFNAEKADFKTFLSLIPVIYSKDFESLKASGKMALSGYFKGKMTDDLMPGFGVKLNIDNGNFKYPDLPKSLQSVYVDLVVDNPSGIMDKTIVNLSRFDANVAGEPIHANLLLKTPISNPYIDAGLKGNINLDQYRELIPLESSTELKGLIKSDLNFKGYVSSIEKNELDQFDANGVIEAVNLHYKDPENLPRGTDLNAKMSFSPKTVQLEQFKGTSGMSDFNLVGHIDNLFGYMLKDELLKGAFTFNSNYFNANEFLTEEEVNKEAAPTDTLPLQAFEVPGNLDFEFNSQINKLVYDNLNLSDLAGTIVLRDNQLFFRKVGVNVFGGSMNLDGVYDSKNPKFPFSSVDFNVKALDIIQTFNSFDMVKQMMPIAKYTEGLFNAKIQLANNFNQDLSVAYPTVSGVIQMGLSDASVKNMPILNEIASKLKIDKLKNLNLKDLNFKMNLVNGKMILDSMVLPLWTGAKAKISGFTALDQSIQYVAKLSIPRKDFGEANTALNSLTAQAQQKGINVPLSDMVDVDVLIGGFFNKPDVKVSLHDAKNNLVSGLKNELNNQVNQKKQELNDEAKRRADEAKQKAQDSINNLKQAQIDKLNAEKKAAEEKLAAEKKAAEEKAKAEADRLKEEAAKKLKDNIKNPFKK
jgi:hypothetical protein